MDQSTLYKTCPFCNKDYKKLGIHLTHCPDRNGRDFEHLLSQKTLDKRSGKKTKETCPKCGKKFDRLDTHLRTSATCKDTQPNRNHPENVPSSFVSSPTVSPSQPTQFLQFPRETHPLPSQIPHMTTALRMKLLHTAEGWCEADEHLRQVVVPRVLHEIDVNTMNHVLSLGIYSYFSLKYGTQEVNEHHRRQTKLQKHRNDLNKALMEKKAAKKRLRQMRRSGSDPETVRQLAYEFHTLVRAHSHLNKIVRKGERLASQKLQRKECRKDIHKFARKILNDENYTSIEPTFSQQDAEAYFTKVYSSDTKVFTRPSWMPEASDPSVEFDIRAFTAEEVTLVISRSKLTSCPSPMDQIPYLVLKKCPSLMPALLHLFNSCWTTKKVPAAWKVGVLKLLGKKKAEEDPKLPKHFRPIALTSCIGKVFTSLLKQRWMDYMKGNNYLNTVVQKAFVDGVPGCTEHHLKLLSILNEARRKRRSMCVCWLDLANAFGSVHHSLIQYSFGHYHAPREMLEMIFNLYQGLFGVISCKSWQTAPIHLQIGVFQGDPLSVLVFNTVMNTLVDTITKQYSTLGYKLDASSSRSNLLQYADDTSLLADGPSSCQTLLSATETWLSWSGMKANVSKCVCLAIQASTGKPYDPMLKLNGESIPFIGGSTFSFLGAPVSIHGAYDTTRHDLVGKLQTFLEKVDKTLVSAQQKLLLFKVAICPRMTWDLSVNLFPVSWLESTLQPIATKFLKKWSGLAKSADTGCLFLPKEKGGLELPSLVTMHKKLQVIKAAAYTCSRDPVVRAIATQEIRREANQVRPSFKPYQIVVAAMQEDPGASSKQVGKRAKSRVEEADTSTRFAHSTGLAKQNQPIRDDSRAPQLWSSTIITLPERVLRFALNSLTDTLPHNDNLHLWRSIPSPSCTLCGERQTLLHVLNGCRYALEKRRYDDRHNDILECIHAFLANQLTPSQNITVDLPNQFYSFPQQAACTNSRPDIVIWDKSAITIIELTVPFELCIESAVTRKTERYSELLSTCRKSGYQANLMTLKVGSRGFIHTASFDALYQSFPATRGKRDALEREIVRKCLLQSYRIWCKRNWKEHTTT